MSRAAAAVLFLMMLLVTGSYLIGRMSPPDPAAVFLFDESTAVTVAWVDSRTGARFRHTYHGILLNRDFMTISDDCQIPVKKRNGEIHLAFLDLQTGRMRTYLSGGSMLFAGTASPDGRYWRFQFWDTTTTQLYRVILNLETAAYVTKPIVMGSYLEGAWSPDSQHLIEIIGEPPQGAADYRISPGNIPAFLVNPATNAAIALPPATPGFYRWSPDSRLFAALTENGTVNVLDINGKIQHKLAQFTQVAMLRWLPDSRRLLLMARNAPAEDTTIPYHIAVWSLDDDHLTIHPVEIPPAGFPWFAPDLSRFYYDALNAPPAIFDTQTGRTIMALPGDDLPLRGLFWSADGRYVILLRQNELMQSDYRGGIYVVDTLTQTTAYHPEIPEYLRWQYHLPASEFGYFNPMHPRLGRIRPAESGMIAREIDQPGADYGVWCYPQGV